MNITQQEILELAKLEDFPSNAQEFIEVIGMESFIKLSCSFGGNTIYIPTYEKTLMPIRNRLIRAKYNGLIGKGYSNSRAAKELSNEYGLTGKQIYHIVSAERDGDI